MKKYIITLLLAIVGTFSAWADGVKTCVVVEFKSGETLALALEDQPKAQFEQNDLVLTSAEFEGRYTTTDVKRFYFDEKETAIKTIEANDNRSNGEIYDIEGRKVGSYNGTIDATTLPQGVYVVKTQSGKSFKVTKK